MISQAQTKGLPEIALSSGRPNLLLGVILLESELGSKWIAVTAHYKSDIKLIFLIHTELDTMHIHSRKILTHLRANRERGRVDRRGEEGSALDNVPQFTSHRSHSE